MVWIQLFPHLNTNWLNTISDSTCHPYYIYSTYTKICLRTLHSDCYSILHANSTLFWLALYYVVKGAKPIPRSFSNFLANYDSSWTSESACQSSMEYLLKCWWLFLWGRSGMSAIPNLSSSENSSGVSLPQTVFPSGPLPTLPSRQSDNTWLSEKFMVFLNTCSAHVELYPNKPISWKYCIKIHLIYLIYQTS